MTPRSATPHLKSVGPGVPPPGPVDEPRAAGELFERYSAYVARVVFRVLGRDAEVDDVVQDVFSIVLAKHRQLDEVLSVRHWLAGIAVKRARDVLRRRKVRMAFLRERPDYQETVHHNGELLAQLHQTLDRLSPDLRIAWVLRHMEGESMEDVAAICGCSLATAKRRVSAAQQVAREVMGDE